MPGIVETPAAMARRLAPNRATVEMVQDMLRKLGFPEVGEVDGKPGDRTRQAIAAFRLHAKEKLGVDLPVTGEIDGALIAALRVAPPREISAERKNAGFGKLIRSPGVIAPVLSGVAGFFGLSLEAVDVAGAISAVNKAKALSEALQNAGPAVVVSAVALAAGTFGYVWMRRRYRAGNHV